MSCELRDHTLVGHDDDEPTSIRWATVALGPATMLCSAAPVDDCVFMIVA